jgi:hypothetical protein
VQDHASQLFWLPATLLLLVCPKNVSGGYKVSARFGKQHNNLVNPIIDYTLFFLTGVLTNARNRHFDFHLFKTEDQLLPHNRLRANIQNVSILEPEIRGSTMIVVINNSREAFWVNESKYL